MPVFISYSHCDSDFVDRLAAQLVLNRVRLWIDKWELNIGDSILDRVQEAIGGAGALIIVLSSASVQSPWCGKEINAGLTRELAERRVVVLPVLLEDCEIPMFLRDKRYADFRTTFDAGLGELLAALRMVDNETQGRMERPDFHLDWAIDWGWLQDEFMIRITALLLDANKPYSVLSEARILLDDILTARYKAFEIEGLDWIQRLAIIDSLGECTSKNKIHFFLDDQFEKEKRITFHDNNTGGVISSIFTCRRMGRDVGQGIFVDLSDLLGQVCRAILEATPKATTEEAICFETLKRRLK